MKYSNYAWRQSNGEYIYLSAMDTNHLTNAMNMCKRNVSGRYNGLSKSNWVRKFQRELLKRTHKIESYVIY